jgi:hypothetical protein
MGFMVFARETYLKQRVAWTDRSQAKDYNATYFGAGSSKRKMNVANGQQGGIEGQWRYFGMYTRRGGVAHSASYDPNSFQR